MAGFLPQLVDRTHGTLPTVRPHWVSRFGASWFGEPRLWLGSVFDPVSLSQIAPTPLDGENIDVEEREGDPWRSLLPPESIYPDSSTLTAFLDQREAVFAETEGITETQPSQVPLSPIPPEIPAQPAPHLPQRPDELTNVDLSVSKTLQLESLLPHQTKTQEAGVQSRDRPTFPLVPSVSASIPQNLLFGDPVTSKANPITEYSHTSPSVSPSPTAEHSPAQLSSERLTALSPQTTEAFPQEPIASFSVPIASEPLPRSPSLPHLSGSSTPQPLLEVLGSTQNSISLNHRSEITTRSDLRLNMRDSMLRSPPDSVGQPQAEQQLKVNMTSHLTPLNPSITPSVVVRSEAPGWQDNTASRDRQNFELKTVSDLDITATPLPTIEISIGRIEIRVKSAQTTAPKSQTRSTARSPQVSLSDYLQNRNGQAEGGST